MNKKTLLIAMILAILLAFLTSCGDGSEPPNLADIAETIHPFKMGGEVRDVSQNETGDEETAEVEMVITFGSIFSDTYDISVHVIRHTETLEIAIEITGGFLGEKFDYQWSGTNDFSEIAIFGITDGKISIVLEPYEDGTNGEVHLAIMDSDGLGINIILESKYFPSLTIVNYSD